MNFQHALMVLKDRWRISAKVFGGIVLLSIVLSLIWPKQYTAYSSVVVDAKPDPITGATGMAEMAMEAFVTTQVDVISSERVAQRVVKDLKLETDPDLRKKWMKATSGVGDVSIWLADYLLQKKLAVTTGQLNPQHPGNVIHIAVKWRDPKMAAALANAFAQEAIDTAIELKVEPARQYSTWFVQRSTELHRDLEAKQKALSDFQNASGITATDEKVDVENDKLTQLTTALVAAQTARQEAESHLHQVSGSNESLPEVVSSPLIAGLKNQLSDAEAKESDAASRLGRNHPDYLSAVAEVNSLKNRIAQETGKIAASLDTSAKANARREADLHQAVEVQKKKVLELKHQHDQSAVLENDVLAVQHDLDAVNQRLSQTNLEGQTQQTNVVLLTSAALPVEPSSPKLLLNVALGVFLGLAFGIGTALLLEARDPRIRRDEELLKLLKVPVLAKFDSIKPPSAGVVPTGSPAVQS
jgi:chain length determinant protein EpsF